MPALVDSSLVPFSTIIQGVEDKPVSFIFRGEDRSGYNRPLKIQVFEISRHGRLFNNKGEILETNFLVPGNISYPYNDGLPVTFRTNKDFFNEPHSSERRSLDCSIYFKVIASATSVAENDTTFVESSPGRLVIKVTNVNDPPSLAVRYSKNVVETFSSLSWDRNECARGRVTSKCRSKFVINHIRVNDVDGNLDFVRVDVSSSHGILSLNEVHLNKTDFTSCSNRSQYEQINEDILWNCEGAGIGDQKMTFTARPLHLNDIFTNMTYESIEPGEDTIIITIYDGSRGECLSDFEHTQRYMINSYMGQQTLHLGRCNSIVRSLSVQVKRHTSSDVYANKIFPIQLLVAIVFAGLVILTVFIIVPFTRWLRRIKGRHGDKRARKGGRRRKKHFTKRVFSTSKKTKKESDYGGGEKTRRNKFPSFNRGRRRNTSFFENIEIEVEDKFSDSDVSSYGSSNGELSENDSSMSSSFEGSEHSSVSSSVSSHYFQK